jgi:hypothetical protein
MRYNTLAIFNQDQLVEVEAVLNQFNLLTQGDKNSLIKAVEDYNFLKSLIVRGFTQQVVFFLLNPESISSEEVVEQFLSRLEVWLMIVESKDEQRKYAEILNNYRDIVYCFHDEEILALRFSLLDVLRELEESKAAKKEKKRYDLWERYNFLTQYEAPMQVDPRYEEYVELMEEYSQLFKSESFEVPNIKNKVSYDQPSFLEAFMGTWKIPEDYVSPVLYQDN